MKYLAAFLLMVLFALLETMPFFYNLGSWFPDFTLLLVVALGLLEGSVAGGLAGLTGGFLLGAFSLHLFGTRAILFGVIGAFTGYLKEAFYLKNPLAIFLTGLGTIGLEKLFFWGMLGFPAEFFNPEFYFSLPLNAFCLLGIYYFLSSFWNRETYRTARRW